MTRPPRTHARPDHAETAAPRRDGNASPRLRAGIRAGDLVLRNPRGSNDRLNTSLDERPLPFGVLP